ncbi:MAG: hypothetical protein V6Z89_06430 [Desulfobacter sp.]
MTAKKIKLIYLLGTSFSGSTLTGYLIGASGRVFNAGEFMLFSRKKSIGEIPCFCGEKNRDCGFWKKMDLAHARLYSKPDRKTMAILLARLVLGKSLCPVFKRGAWDDIRFCRDLLENMKTKDGESTVILDASKSLFRLMYLNCTGAFDIRVVYIKRDLLGNMASFVKNKDSIFKGFANYKLNHFFMPLFLKRHRLSHHFLSYTCLCRSPDRELQRLGRFLDMPLSYDTVCRDIRKRRFHVFTGSNTRIQFRDFKGIQYDQSWKTRLSRFQQRLLRLVAGRSER